MTQDMAGVPHGKPLCPACGRDAQAGRRFCSWCGQLTLVTERRVRAVGGERRLGACLVDVALLLLVMGTSAAADARLGTPYVCYAGALVAWFLLYLILWADGLTPGKLVLGVRVVGTDGRHGGFWRMALRETVGKLVSALVLLLGFLWILWDKDRQGWHDKIAGTLVVSER